MEYSNALFQGGYQNSANWSRCGKPWHVSEWRLAAVIETRGTTRYQEKFAIKYILTTGATTATTIIYALKSWIIFIVYSVPGFFFSSAILEEHHAKPSEKTKRKWEPQQYLETPSVSLHNDDSNNRAVTYLSWKNPMSFVCAACLARLFFIFFAILCEMAISM